MANRPVQNMKHIAAVLSFCLFTVSGWCVTREWTNALGGNWFSPANWSPNGVPGANDIASITNSGTYAVLVPTGSVASLVLKLGGTSGKQTLVYGSTAGRLSLSNSTVFANGILFVTNSGLAGALWVKPGGELRFDTASGLQLYSFSLTNQGTVNWTNGALAVGGNNNETTYVTNAGLWQIFGDANINYGGGSAPILVNSGTVRKLGGTGMTTIGMDVINLAAGVVDVSSGTLQLAALATNVLGGTFTATAPGALNFRNGTTDAGGTASGSGAIRYLAGNFYLRTNTVPGLKLAGGDLYIVSTNTFQLAGIITNLTLDGAYLHGTNRLGGMLTISSGGIMDTLTVLSSGQLEFASGSATLLYGVTLLNQGTVNWSGPGLNVGGTPGTVISNDGTWTMTGDGSLNFGGGSAALFTNAGTVLKTGGNGTSSFSGITFVNQASGLVEVDSGTIQMPAGYTNAAGTLRLQGGTFGMSAITMTGGTLDGSGVVNPSPNLLGGTISPGPGAGSIQFSSGVTFGPGATVVIDGTGTTPGTGYDQLSANSGVVALDNCALQVPSLPVVPAGTTFVILTNKTGTISGTFSGLAENSMLSASGQAFRIHYTGGPGGAVTLVRAWPDLVFDSYSGGNSHLLGNGIGSAVYTVQATTNFLQWTNIGFATGSVSGAFSFVDTNASHFRYRFYRTTH